ncbi:Uncharacterised protein [Vibrio cholerae]|nr:Uncharacterised protein [Vibrio cholerae]CSI35469.1 Uncharacterised protein [Vibrio cholerae]
MHRAKSDCHTADTSHRKHSERGDDQILTTQRINLLRIGR